MREPTHRKQGVGKLTNKKQITTNPNTDYVTTLIRTEQTTLEGGISTNLLSTKGPTRLLCTIHLS